MTSLDYDKTHWEAPCPKVNCRKEPVGLHYANIPTTLGDDKTGVVPEVGMYSNSIVVYEANGAVYIYSAEGVPVKVKEGV